MTPPDKTRQLCNLWKADRTIAATMLAARNAEFAAKLAGEPGMRLIQDNAIWKPPSGKALLATRTPRTWSFVPMNMPTCWIALDDTYADTGTIYYARGSNHWGDLGTGGTFHAPDDWLGHVHEWRRRASSSSSCRSRCRPAARPSTTAGRSTAARRTSARTPSGARSSATC